MLPRWITYTCPSTAFSSLHPRLLQEGAASWLCGLRVLGGQWFLLRSCISAGTLLGCIQKIFTDGGLNHVPCWDSPLKSLMVTCDLQSHLPTLVFLFYLPRSVVFEGGLSLGTAEPAAWAVLHRVIKQEVPLAHSGQYLWFVIVIFQ